MCVLKSIYTKNNLYYYWLNFRRSKKGDISVVYYFKLVSTLATTGINISSKNELINEHKTQDEIMLH